LKVPKIWDPQDVIEYTVLKGLKALATKIDKLRRWGDWTMTCPKMRVRVSCDKRSECEDGRWVLKQQTFTQENLGLIEGSALTFGPRNVVSVGEAAKFRRDGYRHFALKNLAAESAIQALMQRCAGAG
jgi:hypothetical protein